MSVAQKLLLGSGSNRSIFTLSTNSVRFTAGVPDATSWLWNFGDGATSALENPTHTYNASGTYQASLTAYARQSLIGVTPISVAVGAEVTAKSPVTATSLINVLSSVSWTFGDGGSGAVSPITYSYAAAGTFTITCVANSLPSTTQPITVLPEVVVNVSAQFTASVTGATSWAWDFGDGSSTSTLENPTHTYTVAGEYTLSLTSFVIVSGRRKVLSVRTINVHVSSGFPTLVTAIGSISPYGAMSVTGVSAWTTYTCAMTTSPRRISCSGSIFVAISYSTIYSSIDGVTWVLRLTVGSLKDVIWDGTRFVALDYTANSNTLYVSTDGISWSTVTTGIAALYQISMAFALGKWYMSVQMGGSVNRVYSCSTFNSGWTLAYTGLAVVNEPLVIGGPTELCYYEDTGVAGKVTRTTDGSTWVTSTTSTRAIWSYTNSARRVAYANNHAVGIADNGLTTYKLYDMYLGVLYERALPVAMLPSSICWTGSVWVISSSGEMYTSPDLLSWTVRATLAIDAVSACASIPTQ